MAEVPDLPVVVFAERLGIELTPAQRRLLNQLYKRQADGTYVLRKISLAKRR